MNDKLRITTFTGRSIDPFAIRADEIDIMDIAHALSMQCRFNGHCRQFYSVAEHSVHVSYSVPIEEALQALLHDATEAYLGDIPSPVKSRLQEAQELENGIYESIAEAFGLPLALSDAVLVADHDVLQSELATLFDRGASNITPQIRIEGWSPIESKKTFLDRFSHLSAL